MVVAVFIVQNQSERKYCFLRPNIEVLNSLVDDKMGKISLPKIIFHSHVKKNQSRSLII